MCSVAQSCLTPASAALAERFFITAPPGKPSLGFGGQKVSQGVGRPCSLCGLRPGLSQLLAAPGVPGPVAASLLSLPPAASSPYVSYKDT